MQRTKCKGHERDGAGASALVTVTALHFRPKNTQWAALDERSQLLCALLLPASEEEDATNIYKKKQVCYCVHSNAGGRRVWYGALGVFHRGCY